MSPTTSTKPPVLFIHGLWLHGESWLHWIQCFREAGYEASAASWPGDGQTGAATRRNPAAVANHGVRAIVDHIAAQIEKLGQSPILIGHSFGGLFAQNLLGRGLAAAAIAIDPAPIQGVNDLPLSAIRSALPVLRNPLNVSRAVSLTEPQFRYAFANAIPAEEAHQLHEAHIVPTPARPLFQASFAMLNPKAETAVNVENSRRGPLLLIAGSNDHIVPAQMVRSTLRRYRRSSAVTDFREFPGRGHSLALDHGWRDIANFCLTWLRDKGF